MAIAIQSELKALFNEVLVDFVNVDSVGMLLCKKRRRLRLLLLFIEMKCQTYHHLAFLMLHKFCYSAVQKGLVVLNR